MRYLLVVSISLLLYGCTIKTQSKVPAYLMPPMPTHRVPIQKQLSLVEALPKSLGYTAITLSYSNNVDGLGFYTQTGLQKSPDFVVWTDLFVTNFTTSVVYSNNFTEPQMFFRAFNRF